MEMAVDRRVNSSKGKSSSMEEYGKIDTNVGMVWMVNRNNREVEDRRGKIEELTKRTERKDQDLARLLNLKEEILRKVQERKDRTGVLEETVERSKCKTCGSDTMERVLKIEEYLKRDILEKLVDLKN